MDKKKVAHYISKSLLSLMMLGGAGMYFAQYQEVSTMFESLGYPTYIIYPLAIAKVLGVVAIWLRKSQTLTNLAYAGFFYDFILASSAHWVVADGEFFGPLIPLAFCITAYFTQPQTEAAVA